MSSALDVIRRLQLRWHTYPTGRSIVGDLDQVLRRHAGLKMHEHHSHQGSMAPLALRGVIETFHKGNCYKTPIVVLLFAGFPAPGNLISYVVATGQLAFSPSHPHLDQSSGLIRHPYLDHWSPTSHLVEFIEILQATFASFPPLYSRPNPNPTLTSTPPPAHRPAPSPTPPPHHPFPLHSSSSSS
ncbi:MAG: hypothetical protein Q8P67_27985, partial [archaeon]|nr:hypothetical protein [archaeon]